MRKFVSVFMLFLLSVIALPVVASAAPALTVDVVSGIDGKGKVGRSGPVVVTVENTGTPFQGDLVIDVMESYNSGTGQSIPLQIGTGERRTVSFVIHDMGEAFNAYDPQVAKKIYLYEGGWEKGTLLAHKGAQKFAASIVEDHDKFVVAFTKDMKRLSALRSVNIGNYSQVQVADGSKAKIDDLPKESATWDAADYIVVDNFSIADLPDETQRAVLEWVRAGGIMIVGASDEITENESLFSDILPLKLSNDTQLNPSLLNEWTKLASFTAPIPAYAAKLNTDAISLVEDGENVAVAYGKVGHGLVMQTAFSLGDEVVIKSANVDDLWRSLLTASEEIVPLSFEHHGMITQELLYNVAETNALFPSFKVSVPIIFGIVLFYIVLIVPVLYIVLKGRDKREYAWGVIPVIAILTTIAIFGYGAKDRIGRAQLQQTAVVSVEQDGTLKGYFTEAVLSNKSGDFTFSAPKGTTLSASMPNSLFGSGPSEFHKHAIVETDDEQATIKLRDVGYWNVATVYGQSTFEREGQFETTLTVANKKLTGTVKNEFSFPLTDVAILTGRTIIPIGHLKVGETVEVDELLKTSTLSPVLSTGRYIEAQIDGNDLMGMRKESVKTFAGQYMRDEQKPMVIGYTDERIVPVTLENQKTEMSALTLITQPIDVALIAEGPMTIDSEMMDVAFHSVDENYMSDQFGEFHAFYDEADYVQTFQAPLSIREIIVDWTSLTVKNVHKNLYSARLLNIQTGNFEPLETASLEITENPAHYISEDGTVSVKFKFHKGQYGEIDVLPQLELIGEVAQ